MDSVDVELGLDVGEMLLDRPDPRQDWVFSGGCNPFGGTPEY